MNKRVGAESSMGFGGRMVSQESQENLTIAEDLCRKKRPEEAIPYLAKAMRDPNNLDADIQFCFLQPNLDMSMQVLEVAEKKGRVALKRLFGPRTYDDDGDQVGNLWTMINTRPYMRVLQAMVRIGFEKGDYNKTADTIIEMLRLCPGDNMGQRSWLGSVLLQAGRPKEALSFAHAWLQPETRQRGDPPPRGGCVFNAPSPDPIPQEEYQSMLRHCNAELLYTGALAAFKIWGGDSLLARQYLRLGAKNNPTILMRILGKVTRPLPTDQKKRTTTAGLRKTSGRHWTWADGDEAKLYVLKTCSRERCGQREEKSDDWKTHKPGCKEHQERKALSRAMGF